MINVGLCGFTMAVKSYPFHFRVVEVQQTFYEPPSAATMTRWLAAMPREFEFTMKAWQLITHEAKSPTYRRLRSTLDPLEREACGSFRDSAIVRRALATTLDCARVLRASAILFQCPASFRPEPTSVARLRTFFTRIASPVRPTGIRYLWEPRGPAWTERADLARALCRELDLVHVVDPFVVPPPAASLSRQDDTYFRLHGTTGARHSYSDDELRRLIDWTPANAYVMFNNIPRVANAERFLALLDEKAKRRPRRLRA